MCVFTYVEINVKKLSLNLIALSFKHVYNDNKDPFIRPYLLCRSFQGISELSQWDRKGEFGQHGGQVLTRKLLGEVLSLWWESVQGERRKAFPLTFQMF